MNGSERDSSRTSRRVILVCQDCGERTVLGEPLAVWCSGSTRFGCACGRELTLANRLDHQRIGAEQSAMNVAGWPSAIQR